ncbi:MAG: hypothetical protein V9F00_05580 [Nocardioides sp.]
MGVDHSRLARDRLGHPGVGVPHAGHVVVSVEKQLTVDIVHPDTAGLVDVERVVVVAQRLHRRAESVRAALHQHTLVDRSPDAADQLRGPVEAGVDEVLQDRGRA